MNIFLRKMEASVLNIWYCCYARVVATTLDVHCPLFSRVDCVSKQFRLPLWRVKNALEPWIKSQTKTYNVLEIRLISRAEITGQSIISGWTFLVFWCMRINHALANLSFWWVLTSNITGEPDTLSLSMPLDVSSLERA